MKVAVVKYNAGNVQSVIYALERLGVNPMHTDDHEAIMSADKVIFPGQGEASSAMAYLQDKGLDQVLTSLTQPFLGICIGLQLMCKHSEEGDTDCLGIYDLHVKKFPSSIVECFKFNQNRIQRQSIQYSLVCCRSLRCTGVCSQNNLCIEIRSPAFGTLPTTNVPPSKRVTPV